MGITKGETSAATTREFAQAQGRFLMLCLFALAVSVLYLPGCFDFNKTFDPPPTATFQIVISSTNYGGTYEWTPQDQAYEAVILGQRYYTYMDGTSGIWYLSGPNTMSTVIANSTSPYYGTLPPTSTLRWSGSGTIISGISDSEGGISDRSSAPDGPINTADTLQVAFLASSSGNSATYQWQRSSNSSFDSPVLIGTGSTYTVQIGTDHGKWIHVIITPTDNTGTIQGTPVVSPPVDWP